MRVFGFLTVLAAIAAAIVLILGMKGAQSAPQEAAIAALAVAIAVIPYVLFRALHSMSQADELVAIRQLLEKGLPGAQATSDIAVVKEPAAAVEDAPQAQTEGHVVATHGMGQEGWMWHQMSNGAIRISDPHGANYDYPSLVAAKDAFTWWKGPAST